MLRLLLIDDHTLFRELLVPFLKELAKKAVIYEASNIEEGKDLIKFYKHIDLILLDLSFPNDHAWRQFPFKSNLFKKIPVIILTASTSTEDLQMALDKGCKGYVTKSSSKQQLTNGINTVLAGSTYVSPDMHLLLDGRQSSKTKTHRINSHTILDQLSSRQQEILILMTKGHSNKKIAQRCKISEGTVKLHVSTILKVLNVSNRTQAVIKVNELNVI